MSMNCFVENNQYVTEIFDFFDNLPQKPIKVFANPVAYELYSIYSKGEYNSYKCFGKKEELPNLETVSGKDILLIDIGIIDGITVFRKFCMLYKMQARSVCTYCYFMSTRYPDILKEAGRYKAVSYEFFKGEEIDQFKKFQKSIHCRRHFSLESVCHFEKDMYNAKYGINEKIKESVWKLKECTKCNGKDSYYKVSSSQLTSEQREYLLSTGVIEYMDDEWFFVAESALSILSCFDSTTESIFWIAVDVLYYKYRFYDEKDIYFMKMYEPFLNAYENEAVSLNFFGLDIDKAEFDRLKEWYGHQTYFQILEQVCFRRSMARMVCYKKEHPYHEAQQVAQEIYNFDC